MAVPMYAMFGSDHDGYPVVASNVTAEDAKQLAKARKLNGFHLWPMDPYANSRGTVSYIDVDGHQNYEIWEMYFWLLDNYGHAKWRPDDIADEKKSAREKVRGSDKHDRA